MWMSVLNGGLIGHCEGLSWYCPSCYCFLGEGLPLNCHCSSQWHNIISQDCWCLTCETHCQDCNGYNPPKRKSLWPELWERLDIPECPERIDLVYRLCNLCSLLLWLSHGIDAAVTLATITVATPNGDTTMMTQFVILAVTSFSSSLSI